MEHDFDNDTRYRTPRAWRNFKRMFGRFLSMDALAERFERIARTPGSCGHFPRDSCPRSYLAAAMHHFASQPPKAREAILRNHSQWMDSTDGKRAPQPWPEGDVTPVRPSMAKLWATYGPPPGMHPNGIPATVTLIGTPYRVVVSQCPRLFLRKSGDTREVHYVVDTDAHTVLLPGTVTAEDWPAVVSAMEESAACHVVSEEPDPPPAAPLAVYLDGLAYGVGLTDAPDGYALDADGEKCMCVVDDKLRTVTFSRSVTLTDMMRILCNLAAEREIGGDGRRAA